MQFYKKTVILLMVSFLMIFSFIPTHSHMVYAATPSFDIGVDSAILLEASTGKVLYKKNENTPLPPASMTKMMTEYLVLDQIKQGKLTWETKVKASEYAYFMAQRGSRVMLNLNEERTVRELFEGMAVASANDATVALAEQIAGSEPNFVKMMNEKAKEFGMNNTHFLNASGYPPEEMGEYAPEGMGSDMHYMSARDAAILAQRLLQDFPEITQFTSLSSITFPPDPMGATRPAQHTNWNKLVVEGSPFQYPGADGLKTGSTDAAKYCLTSTAQRDGMRLIAVVMRAETEDVRFNESRRLLDFGFQNFEMKEIVPQGASKWGTEENDVTAKVKKGKEKEVSVKTADAIRMVVPKGEDLAYEVTVEYDQDHLVAPIKKGDVVGTLSIQLQDGGEYLSQSNQPSLTTDLIAQEDVEKASWIRLVFRAIIGFFVGIFHAIVDTVSSWF
ncbi:D-alanyl-D-alanine carboxypeptidase family protein [Rubeoparvulum massiliense]|uniref:D-alanyl-D-alanine carboxypeptidase family protein n=1 Tax=Rubeoparvulum massiliense TaxID=1631346 RepID=UPI00065E7924|nr:D-alanyl-D-alanine carboxypeptidase family protein [Rubeoparvulum massiliense]